MIYGQESTVLIIDDNEVNLSVARLILEKTLKCRVLTADNAIEGLKLMKSQPISVVLLDIEMPVMDGFEALEEIRATKRIQDIPVIMLTAVADRDTIAKVMEQGVEGYIKKPFLPEKLTEKVAKFLRVVAKAITVMVVDDDDMARTSVGNWISNALPYHVIKAKSGAAALEQLRNHPVQIVLLDVGMPGMDGFQVLNIMDMSGKFKDVRVILMLETEDEEELAKDETSELLAGQIRKPLDRDLLVELLVKTARSCPGCDSAAKYKKADADAVSNINFCV